MIHKTDIIKLNIIKLNFPFSATASPYPIKATHL